MREMSIHPEKGETMSHRPVRRNRASPAPRWMRSSTRPIATRTVRCRRTSSTRRRCCWAKHPNRCRAANKEATKKSGPRARFFIGCSVQKTSHGQDARLARRGASAHQRVLGAALRAAGVIDAVLRLLEGLHVRKHAAFLANELLRVLHAAMLTGRGYRRKTAAAPEAAAIATTAAITASRGLIGRFSGFW